jgi:hypothetical protein
MSFRDLRSYIPVVFYIHLRHDNFSETISYGYMFRHILRVIIRPLHLYSEVAKSPFMRIIIKNSKAVSLHAMEALGGRGGIAPTHSRPRH